MQPAPGHRTEAQRFAQGGQADGIGTVAGEVCLLTGERRVQRDGGQLAAQQGLLAVCAQSGRRAGGTAQPQERHLVDARQHGNQLFMEPQKAVQDAVWDVCAHEMAVMAGTRAALLALSPAAHTLTDRTTLETDR